MLDQAGIQAIQLTVKLAATTTAVLLVAGTPLAWWLSRTRSWVKGPVGALVALPLVLPPVVLGFYLLVLMGPQGPLGQFTQSMGWGVLPVTLRKAPSSIWLVCVSCNCPSLVRQLPATLAGTIHR